MASDKESGPTDEVGFIERGRRSEMSKLDRVVMMFAFVALAVAIVLGLVAMLMVLVYE